VTVTADLPPAGAAPGTARTKALLVCGAGVGPLFVTVFLVLGALRPAYNPLRHSISTLALGEFGWIQRLNFLVAGLLTLAFAVGLRRVLWPQQGSFWGPSLIGLWAVGLLGAGLFVTDPTAGYPPGTPAKIPDPSLHGILHNLAAGLGFPALVAACVVLARRFAARGQRGWALYSAASGAVLFISTVLASYGFPRAEGLGQFGGLFQRIAVVCGWGWLTVLAILLLRSGGPSGPIAQARRGGRGG
jgi:Protein of unknown function (DUF998)